MELPQEIIDRIVEFVDADEVGTVGLVNRAFGRSARGRMWRVVRVTMGEWERLVRRVGGRTLLARAAAHVREIAVEAETGKLGGDAFGTAVGAHAHERAAGLSVARFAAAAGGGLRALRVAAAGAVSADHFWAVAQACAQLARVDVAVAAAAGGSSSNNSNSSSNSSNSNSNGGGAKNGDEIVRALAACGARLAHVTLRAVPPPVPSLASVSSVSSALPAPPAALALAADASPPSPPPLSPRAFDALADAAAALASFRLVWAAAAPRASRDSLRFAPALGRLIAANPGLSDLSIDWCLSPSELQAVVDVACQHLTHLQSLRVGGFDSLSSIACLVRANPNLTSLILVDMMANVISAADIESFFAHQGDSAPTCAMAETCQKISPESTIPLTHRLTRLELDGTGHILATIPLASRFTSLKHLKIIPSRLSASMPFDRTDTLVSAALRNLPSLITLHIPIIANEPMYAVAETCTLLESLDIVDGARVSDPALILVSRNCSRLARIRLGAASQLTDASITVLARARGTTLVELVLPLRAPNITDASLVAISAACGPALESLLNVPVDPSFSTANEITAARVGVTRATLLDAVPRLHRRLRTLGLCLLDREAAISAPATPYSFATESARSCSPSRLAAFLSRADIDALKAQCRRLKSVLVVS